MADPRRLLRSPFEGLPRTYWVIWLGVLVNRVGTMVVPFLALYLTGQRQMSVVAAGAAVTAVGAGGMVSQLIGGSLTDRWGRRSTFVAGPVCAAAALLLLGYARHPGLIFAAAALYGLSLQVYQPASAAIVAEAVAAGDRPRAYGLLFWAVNLGFSIAAVAGGLLAQHGYALLFWVDALTCLLFGLVIWRGLPPDAPATGPPATSAPGGYLVVLRDRAMTVYALLLLLHVTVQFQATTTLPLAMAGDGLGPSVFGVAVALNGVVVVVVQPFVLERLGRLDHSRVMASGVALLGLGFGATAFAHTLPAYGATVVVWTTGEIAIAAVVQSIVAGLAPPELRGRYNGLFGAAYALAAVVAPACGAALFAHLGPRVLWLACLAVCGVAAAGQLALGRAIRERAAAERAERIRQGLVAHDSAGGQR